MFAETGVFTLANGSTYVYVRIESRILLNWQPPISHPGRPGLCAGGFTLTELLVVLVVIVLLAVLAIPAASRMLASADRAPCASNLRQIGAAMHSFAADNNGVLPHSIRLVQGRLQCWDKALFDGGYLSDIRVFRCPADKLPRNLGEGEHPRSYALNSNVFYEEGREGELSSSHLRGRPSRASKGISAIVFAFERPTPTFAFNRRSSIAFNNPVPSQMGAPPDPNIPHGSGANYLFGDGHVKFLDYRDEGSNFAAKYFAVSPTP
jgi:prepilin-type processing-associated H-X9-DG protein/prepilin-type N-terminal cleavage/methylation domain-containing protein